MPQPAICVAEGTSIQTLLKCTEMVKLEGRAVSLGWPVSNSSLTVGTAMWQLFATISPGLQTQPGQYAEGGARTEAHRAALTQ